MTQQLGWSVRVSRLFFRCTWASVLVVLLLAFSAGTSALAQVETATLSGTVTDPMGAVVAGAEVHAVRIETGTNYVSTTNSSGLYLIVGLQPGHFRIFVTKQGFKQIELTDVTLNVQDTVSRNFSLEIGAASETVTVRADDLHINTTDGTVSTVVDRQFAENLPMNGRSFQTLIQLTPGVVVTPVGAAELGQFSVNGQRADANYFSVDGVSANTGLSNTNNLRQGASGSVPALSALGGTQSLVSVDALQEFRVQTSSFAPEFGRTPGAQISIVTRSGTNQFHGALFDYLRNDILDANSWFANHSGQPKPKDRQNDFGGVLGGPLWRDRIFFFFSYEGLRLRQPLTRTTVVPSTDPVFGRQTAPAQIQPFLNAYPIPNGRNLANGFAQFSASYSDPSTVDAYSLRVDHIISSRVALFGRWSYSPSEATQRGIRSANAFLGPAALSNTSITLSDVQTLTLGLSQSVTQRIGNEVRANYSNQRAGSSYSLDNFGGAVPLPDSLIVPAGFSSANTFFGLLVTGTDSLGIGRISVNEQRQINLVDNLSATAGNHQLRFGIDYRWLAPFTGPQVYSQVPFFTGMTGPTGALSGVANSVFISALQGAALLLHNFSAYGQDSWKVTPRLSLTYGLRWDINPALKGKNSKNDPFTIQGLSDPATMTLAPPGTPLYQTTYGDVAPRIGVAYGLSQRQGWGSVVRGGFGIFYDLGSGSLGSVTGGFPFAASKSLANVPLPLTPQQASPPPLPSLNPPGAIMFVADPNLKLPRTYQWNAALEQSLGATQVVSVTYVGAVGRDLLRQDTFTKPPNFPQVLITRNTATSDYHAMQLKFQRRLSRGLQALASYTWSHSIDIASNDSGRSTPLVVGNPRLDRGNSDFDVRHSLAGAVSYDLPAPGKGGLVPAILGHWSLDSLVLARSATPVDIQGPVFIVGGTLFITRPNIVPGVPLYLFGSQFPGGKAINFTPGQGGVGCKGPFCPAPAGQQGSFGRNALRGFGAWQTDFAVRRQFHLTEKLSLQFRAEFFNIFNHPNFGPPTNSLSSPLFGQSTETLASSLGSNAVSGGAFNSLYQFGGPRSIQLALKLIF